MSQALAVPLAIAAGALVVSGAMKLRSPDAASVAIASVFAPLPDGAVRLLGLGEALLGALVLLEPSRLTAVALGLAYLFFAGFLVRQRTTGSAAPCGCFGEAGRATGAHIAFDLACAALGACAAIAGPASLTAGLATGYAIVALAAAATGVYLSWALLELGPGAWAAYRGGGGG